MTANQQPRLYPFNAAQRKILVQLGIVIGNIGPSSGAASHLERALIAREEVH